MFRTLCFTIALAALAASALAQAGQAARAYQFPEVQAAWDEAGEDGVKDWMRAMLKRNKKAGRRIASTGGKPKCGSCHESLKTYSLSSNAVDDLRAFLEAEH
jgi:hypothetical protein